METGTEGTDLHKHENTLVLHTYCMYSDMHAHSIYNFSLSFNQMKKKPVKYTGVSDEVDYLVPDYKTVIVISSKDQLNITLSKCGLAMLGNLGTVREEM